MTTYCGTDRQCLSKRLPVLSIAPSLSLSLNILTALPSLTLSPTMTVRSRTQRFVRQPGVSLRYM